MSSAKASGSYLVGFDAFVTVDLLNYDWDLKLYQLSAKDVPLSLGEFIPAHQHAMPPPFAAQLV